MAALMKAVIDREADSVVTTTYNQKTISLAKARARKERPLAFKEESDAEVRDAGKPVELDAGAGAAVGSNGIAHDHDNDNASSISNYQGLGIEGLPINSQGGAEREPTPPASAKITTSVYSTVPSSVATGDADDDNDHDTALSVNEREAVAMSLPPG